jgi:hypothetical protein
VTWHEEALHGLGVQGVEGLILVVALFPLDAGSRREGKKKEKKKKIITMRKDGFCRAGPALLAMQQVTDVKCN